MRVLWRIFEWPAAALLWGWIRLVLATVKTTVEGAPLDGAAIYVCWHRHSVILCTHHARYHRWVMTSPAPYLGPLRCLARILGLRIALGTSGDGGAHALEQLADALRAGAGVSVAVDGPAGPAFHVKRGCALLALRAGAPIVPVAYRTPSGRTLWSRWDRMLWVSFFDRVTIRYGEPIFAAGCTERQLLAAVEAGLQRLDPGPDRSPEL